MIGVSFWIYGGPEQSRIQTNSISKPKRAGRFNTPANILDFRPIFTDEVQLVIDLGKVLAGENLETRNDSLAREVSSGLVRGRLLDLDLQSAFSKVETEDLVDVVLHLGFEDYIMTGDPEIDVTLSDK